nr:uncharacterized mitochondrial protein AtMg00810-like [Tanacetum cinerariifolium]
MESQSETIQTVFALKLPMCKTRDYDLWSMRMKQYLTHTDYALWEFIVNGEAPASIALVSGGVEAAIPPITTKQKIAMRNELKAKNNTSSTNKAVNTAHDVSTASSQGQAFASTYADDVMFSFFANQFNSPHLDNEDLEQIDTDDLEEMDLKCKVTSPVAFVTFNLYHIKANSFLTIEIQIPSCFLYESLHPHGSFSSDTEVNTCSKECLKSYQTLQKQYDQQRKILNKANLEIIAYQLGLESLETRIVIHQKNEDVFEEDISFLKYDVKNKPGHAKINFVKSNKNNKKSVIEQHTYKQAENLGKSQNSRSDKRNWNGMMTRKLRDGFEENKMVGKFMLNNEGKGIGQREVRPVWNNTQRVNHQNFSNNLTHPHPRRNFVPTAVITNSGKVPISTAKQSFPRASASTNTTRYINTAVTRPTVNGAKPSLNVFHKSHSPVRGTFNQRTAPKKSDLKETINTVKVNNVTTTGSKPVVSVVQENGENVVKSSACWIWRLTGNVMCHISKDSESYMLKRFYYVDLQCRLKLVEKLILLFCVQDHPGKFEGKADEGFLVGYFVNSKAFGVFNSRTRKVEENLHIRFLENKSNVARKGPEWPFDIDSLIKAMKYEPVTAGNQTNDDVGIEINVNARQARQEKAYDHEYILLPFIPSHSPLFLSIQSSNDKDADESPGKRDEGVSKESRIDNQERFDSSTQDFNTAEPSINTANTNINTGSLNINTIGSNDPSMSSLEETSIFDDVYDDKEVGVDADTNKLITFNSLHVKQKDDAIFISQDKYVAESLKKFDFTTVKTTSTPMEPNKALIKDAEAEDVDVHLYRLMIGSLMYLTASRPDIMSAVCACATFQVTPKTSHLHVVKRIFITPRVFGSLTSSINSQCTFCNLRVYFKS